MTGKQLAWIIGGAVLSLVGLVALARQVPKSRFAAALPAAGAQYAEFIWESAHRHGVPALLLAAVIAHESGFGLYLTPKGPRGRGDGGHGHGLAQIDDGTWGDWLATHDWGDPAVNIDKGAEILAAALRDFPGNVAAGIAAYNAGPGRVRQAVAKNRPPGSVTTHDKNGRSYVDNVAAQLERLQLRAQA